MVWEAKFVEVNIPRPISFVHPIYKHGKMMNIEINLMEKVITKHELKAANSTTGVVAIYIQMSLDIQMVIIRLR